jgi:hypothetical protein
VSQVPDPQGDPFQVDRLESGDGLGGPVAQHGQVAATGSTSLEHDTPSVLYAATVLLV